MLARERERRGERERGVGARERGKQREERVKPNQGEAGERNGWVTRMRLQPDQHFCVCKSGAQSVQPMALAADSLCVCVLERVTEGVWITAVKPGRQSVTAHLFPFSAIVLST